MRMYYPLPVLIDAFDPAHNAVYYVRVLEIPTPRWSTYDAVVLGLPPSDMVPATIQERAWTSPIWYAGVTPEHRKANPGAYSHTGHKIVDKKK